MNRDFERDINRALGEVEGILGERFQFRGLTYTGIVSNDTVSLSLSSGGFQEELAASITILKAALVKPPIVGEKVILPDGTLARIAKVDSDIFSWQLICATATK